MNFWMISTYRTYIAMMVSFLLPKVGYLPLSKIPPLWDIFVTHSRGEGGPGQKKIIKGDIYIF